MPSKKEWHDPCKDCGGSGHPDDATLYPVEDELGQTVGMEPSRKCERCNGTGWEPKGRAKKEPIQDDDEYEDITEKIRPQIDEANRKSRAIQADKDSDTSDIRKKPSKRIRELAFNHVPPRERTTSSGAIRTDWVVSGILDYLDERLG